MVSQRERYALALERCRAKAETSEQPEIGELWATVGASYAFLYRREERLEAEESERAARHVANQGSFNLPRRPGRPSQAPRSR